MGAASSVVKFTFWTGILPSWTDSNIRYGLLLGQLLSMDLLLVSLILNARSYSRSQLKAVIPSIILGKTRCPQKAGAPFERPPLYPR